MLRHKSPIGAARGLILLAIVAGSIKTEAQPPSTVTGAAAVRLVETWRSTPWSADVCTSGTICVLPHRAECGDACVADRFGANTWSKGEPRVAWVDLKRLDTLHKVHFDKLPVEGLDIVTPTPVDGPSEFHYGIGPERRRFLFVDRLYPDKKRDMFVVHLTPIPQSVGIGFDARFATWTLLAATDSRHPEKAKTKAIRSGLALVCPHPHQIAGSGGVMGFLRCEDQPKLERAVNALAGTDAERSALFVDAITGSRRRMAEIRERLARQVPVDAQAAAMREYLRIMEGLLDAPLWFRCGAGCCTLQ